MQVREREREIRESKRERVVGKERGRENKGEKAKERDSLRERKEDREAF